MILDLRKLSSNYRIKVVVLQPAMRKQVYDAVLPELTTGKSHDVKRYRQLNTLLLGVKADCQALGAEFVALSSDA